MRCLARFRWLSPSLVLAAFVLVAGGAARAKPVQTDHVEAELIAARTAVEPGKPLTLGLRLRMDDTWHTYWRNPGDTGLPTTLAWQLPAGFTAGDIEWPVPQRIDVLSFANYGYEHEIVLPVTISTPATLAAGAPVPIRAHAEWLVCQEQCIPGAADLELDLTAAERSDADPRWAALFAKARADLPREAADWKWAAHRGDGRIDLVWTPPAGGAAPLRPQFFPFAEGVIEPAAKQTLYRLPDGRMRLSLVVSKQSTQLPDSLGGVLSAANGWPVDATAAAPASAADGRPRAISVAMKLDGPPATALGGSVVDSGVTFADGAVSGATTLVAAIALALAGGLILNLMPCVFPVISLKVLGFAEQAHGEARMIRGLGLVFAAGVIASFAVLAAIVIGLRTSGQQLGWGFQLQSPVIVTVLAILFFLLALNIAGFFEVRMLVPGRMATMEAKSPYANAFLSGVLAVVIASPCTAPFMGAALGYALAQPVGEALAVFVALGLGMALPYLALAWHPAWLKRLPRPGPWMQWLKQFLSIPLAATVIWLGWVLALQSGADALVRLAFVLLLVATIVWLLRGEILGRGFRRSLVWLTFAGAIVLAWPLFADPQPGPQSAPAGAVGARGVPGAPGAANPPGVAGTPGAPVIGWQPWSQSELDNATDAGRPVFVDFTAAWCVSCQANKKLVLEREATLKAFAERNVVLMRADWTRRDPAITAALAALGRNGVPVYALYRPGKTTLVLPEILTGGVIADALNTL